MMEVRQAIDDLHCFLDQITAEEQLLRLIDENLTALRLSYPSQRSLFTTRDIEFLKSVGVISNHLRAFLQLKEESECVNSVKEYEDIVSRLVRAKHGLASFPVARRIAKEIRGLNERLPAIRQQDEAQRLFRRHSRIVDLEQTHRRCPRQHPMVIREGSQGYFWGCSRYPFCSATAQLALEEQDLLNS